jgi:hypothetical protein
MKPKPGLFILNWRHWKVASSLHKSFGLGRAESSKAGSQSVKTDKYGVKPSHQFILKIIRFTFVRYQSKYRLK